MTTYEKTEVRIIFRLIAAIILALMLYALITAFDWWLSIVCIPLAIWMTFAVIRYSPLIHDLFNSKKQNSH